MKFNNFLRELDTTICGKTSNRVARLLTRYDELKTRIPILEDTIDNIIKNNKGNLHELLKQEKEELVELKTEFKIIKSELDKIKEMMNQYDGD